MIPQRALDEEKKLTHERTLEVQVREHVVTLPCFGKEAARPLRHIHRNTHRPRRRIGSTYTPSPGYNDSARPVLETRALRNLERPLSSSRPLPSAGGSNVRSARA